VIYRSLFDSEDLRRAGESFQGVGKRGGGGGGGGVGGGGIFILRLSI